MIRGLPEERLKKGEGKRVRRRPYHGKDLVKVTQLTLASSLS